MSFTAHKNGETQEGLDEGLTGFLANIDLFPQDLSDAETENEKQDRIARVFHKFNTTRGKVKTQQGTREVLDKAEMFHLIRMNEDNLQMPEEEVEALWKSYIDASWDKSRDEYINEHELKFI
eukprot:UN23582